MIRKLVLSAFAALALLFVASPSSAQQNPFIGSGSITTNGQAVAQPTLQNAGTCTGDITGVWTGTLKFVIASTSAGTNPAAVTVTTYAGTAISGSTTTSNTTFIATVANAPYFAVLATATMTGKAVVNYTCGAAAMTGGGGGGGSSVTPYDTIILAESSISHYYPLNDTAPCTTAVDSKGGAALTINGAVACGGPSISHDAETSAIFPTQSGSAFISIPSSVLPASGNYTIEFAVLPDVTSTAGLFSMDDGHSPWIFIQSSQVHFNDGNGYITGIGNAASSFSGYGYLIDYTWNGTTEIVYVNGWVTISNAATPNFTDGHIGYLGIYFDGSSFPSQANYAKFAIYNAALTPAQIYAHVSALSHN